MPEHPQVAPNKTEVSARLSKIPLRLPPKIRKAAILGSKTYPKPEIIIKTIQKLGQVTIITGGFPGVEQLVAKIARANNIELKEHVEIDIYGRQYGHRQNRFIMADADVVIIFWDGTCRDIQRTIKIARHHNRALYVFGPNGKIIIEET